MLEKIKITGFKCFDEAELTLKNLTLLTGANSAGKSSVIQAILLLMQQTEQGKNPLNGKYVRLGLMQEIKNAVTNPRKIKVEILSKDQGLSSIAYNLEGEADIKNSEFLKQLDFTYLSAERTGVEDVYKQNLMDEDRIGVHGEYSFDYLSQYRLTRLREEEFIIPEIGVNLGNQVDYWLNYIMGYDVVAERITGTEIVKVSYRRKISGSKEIKPGHVGTGVTYVANVIISALSCKKGGVFVIENPEIHLHPAAQSKLMEFFCFLASKGLQIIMETHSDHIFNGMRKSIKANHISNQEASVYFFKLDDNYISRPIRIQIDGEGIIRNQERGLFDQFDDDLDELLGL